MRTPRGTFVSARLIEATTRSTAEELGERPILVGDVALEREVGAVELQEEAVADDRLVFDPQRVREGIEVSLLGIVVFVLHGRGDDAGRGCGRERLDEAARGLIEHGPKVRAFGIDGRQGRGSGPPRPPWAAGSC